MNQINNKLGLDVISIEKVLDFLPYPFLVSEWRNDSRRNLFVNKKFINEIGYTIDEIPTLEAWFEKAYPDSSYRTEIINAWKEQSSLSEKQDDSVILKARIYTKHLGKLWYEVKASVSGPVHLVAFININEEILREEELKQLSENKSRTLSILSHDLRMPLSNLHSILTLFEDGSLTKEEYSTSIKTLSQKTFHLLEFLDTTLHWTRNNFESITPSIEDVDVEKITNEILKVYESSYLDKGIKVLVDFKDSKKLRSDREIIGITFRNVFSNAVKFTQNGFIKIQSEERSGDYIITITDNGTGMPKEKINAILIGNYQPEKGTRQEKGLGLGLKLCQELLKKVNGKIEIESEPAKGTVVRLVFQK
jgi:signal transduction histidine kinase